MWDMVIRILHIDYLNYKQILQDMISIWLVNQHMFHKEIRILHIHPKMLNKSDHNMMCISLMNHHKSYNYQYIPGKLSNDLHPIQFHDNLVRIVCIDIWFHHNHRID